MTFGSLAARMLLEQWQGVKSSDHDCSGSIEQIDLEGVPQ